MAPPLRQLGVGVLFLGVAAAIAAALWIGRERAVPIERAPTVPVVEVVVVEVGDVPVELESNGRLEAVRRVELGAEVPARVAALGEHFEEGAVVAAGELLFELESIDFELALARAQAGAAQAAAALELEEAQAATAISEWKLVGRGEPGPLVRREPQLAQARALVGAAEVAVRAAELDLARTSVVSPFRARVERRTVEVGMRVTPGQSLGALIGDDDWRVRLLISNADRGFLERLDGEPVGPVVLLVDGRSVSARIERSAATIDPRTQTLSVFARIDDRDAATAGLVAGAYVSARVAGRPLTQATVLPRSALRGDDRVLVIGADEQVFLRSVLVARRDSETIVVTAGLRPGERVVITPLPIAADGMRVRIATPQGAGSGTESGAAGTDR